MLLSVTKFLTHQAPTTSCLQYPPSPLAVRLAVSSSLTLTLRHTASSTNRLPGTKRRHLAALLFRHTAPSAHTTPRFPPLEAHRVLYQLPTKQPNHQVTTPRFTSSFWFRPSTIDFNSLLPLPTAYLAARFPPLQAHRSLYQPTTKQRHLASLLLRHIASSTNCQTIYKSQARSGSLI
jgi:hypothetical protein